jgi:ATP-dependent DNA helicase RecG
MPGLQLEELQQGRARSKPRNPIIAGVLRDLPGGYMERAGTGISYMIQQMRQMNRPDPEFKEQGEFIVIFSSHAKPIVSQVATPEDQAEAPLLRMVSEPIDAALPVERVAPSPSSTSMPELIQERRQELALRYIREHGSITNKQYRELTGVSEATVLRDLEILVQQGSLRAVGQKRGRRYLL